MGNEYSIRTTLDLPFAEAVEQTKRALAEQGFGVLSEIDERLDDGMERGRAGQRTSTSRHGRTCLLDLPSCTDIPISTWRPGHRPAAPQRDTRRFSRDEAVGSHA